MAFAVKTTTPLHKSHREFLFGHSESELQATTQLQCFTGSSWTITKRTPSQQTVVRFAAAPRPVTGTHRRRSLGRSGTGKNGRLPFLLGRFPRWHALFSTTVTTSKWKLVKRTTSCWGTRHTYNPCEGCIDVRPAAEGLEWGVQWHGRGSIGSRMECLNVWI